VARTVLFPIPNVIPAPALGKIRTLPWVDPVLVLDSGRNSNSSVQPIVNLNFK